MMLEQGHWGLLAALPSVTVLSLRPSAVALAPTQLPKQKEPDLHPLSGRLGPHGYCGSCDLSLALEQTLSP